MSARTVLKILAGAWLTFGLLGLASALLAGSYETVSSYPPILLLALGTAAVAWLVPRDTP